MLITVVEFSAEIRNRTCDEGFKLRLKTQAKIKRYELMKCKTKSRLMKKNNKRDMPQTQFHIKFHDI